MDAALIIPAFIAGILTFLAPCTLPLVPGYLGFISGVSTNDLQDPTKAKIARRKIFLNGVLYTIGLAVPFLIIAAGIGSASAYLAKISKYLNVVSIIGGIFLVFLGVLLLTNKLGTRIAYFYQWFDFINYESLLDYL